MWFLGKFHIRWYNINDLYRVSSNYIVKIFPTYFKCFSNFPRVHFFVQLKEIETSPLKKKEKRKEIMINHGTTGSGGQPKHHKCSSTYPGQLSYTRLHSVISYAEI